MGFQQQFFLQKLNTKPVAPYFTGEEHPLFQIINFYP